MPVLPTVLERALDAAETSGDACVVLDEAGRIVTVNHRFRQTHPNYDLDIQKTCEDLIRFSIYNSLYTIPEPYEDPEGFVKWMLSQRQGNPDVLRRRPDGTLLRVRCVHYPGAGSVQFRAVFSDQATDPGHRETFRALRPDASHVGIAGAQAPAPERNGYLLDMAESETMGVALVTGDGHVLDMNRAMARTMDCGDGVLFDTGRIRAAHKEDRTALARAIAKAATADRGGVSLLKLRSPDGTERYQTGVKPAGPGSVMRAIVRVLSPDTPRAATAGVVADALGLTVSQARTALMLARGRPVESIAEALDLPVAQVTAQIEEMSVRNGWATPFAMVADLARIEAVLA